MIRIAFVIDTIETSSAGTEQQLLLLLNNLDRSRFEPHLICLRDSGWLQANELPFPVEIFGLHSLRSFSALTALRRFRRYCRDKRIDIVQSFFVDANLFGTVAARLSGVPVIVSSRRNFGRDYWHTPLWLFVLRRLSSLTTFYISNSRLTADYSVKVEKIRPQNIHVVYNGLDLTQFEAITPKLRAKARGSGSPIAQAPSEDSLHNRR